MLVYGGVLVLAFLTYANTLGYGAAWDDTRFVFESGAREGASAIPDLFARPFLGDIPAGRSPYRPVTASSYALDWTLGSGNAAFFHWTNTALHVGATALVLGVLGALGAAPVAAAWGGALFAVHPVHVEAVANLAGRAELLVAVALLGATFLYLKAWPWRDDEGAPPPWPVLPTLACILALFALGMGAKENAVVLPGLLFTVEALRPARRPVLARLVLRWPVWVGCAAVVAGYLAVRHRVLGTFTTHDVAPFILGMDPGLRVSTAVANWAEYARLMVFPLDLVVDYGPAVLMPAGVTDLRFWAGVSVGVGTTLLAVVAWRRTRLPALGLAWFVVALLPVTNLVVPIAQWMAERFFYLPSVGLSMAVAGVWPFLRHRADEAGRTRVLHGLAVVALVLLLVRSWDRNRSWESTETVVATLIDEHPEAFRAQWLAGIALLEAGRREPGMAALERALSLNPNAIELHLERAAWLLRLGRAQEARTAMEILPGGRHPGRDALLARSLAVLGEPARADSVIREGLRRFPANGELTALRDSLAGR